MGLSFVTSAVQIGTSDGGFEETAIANEETEAVNRRNEHKPLFEQLRSNQEEDQEKKEELERQIMRSACALDDEDIAHLDSLERQRSDRERTIQEKTQHDLENFRAAKALRQQVAIAGDHKDDDFNGSKSISRSVASSTGIENDVVTPGVMELVTSVPLSSSPVIKVKKRKRIRNPIETTSKHKDFEEKRKLVLNANSESQLGETDQSALYLNETRNTSRKETETLPIISKSKDGLGDLLTGYGSSSDDE